MTHPTDLQTGKSTVSSILTVEMKGGEGGEKNLKILMLKLETKVEKDEHLLGPCHIFKHIHATVYILHPPPFPIGPIWPSCCQCNI